MKITIYETDAALRYVVELLREPAHSWANSVADQIEAQTPAPRILEPAIWGVVRARVDHPTYPNAYKWVRDEIGWICLDVSLRVSGFEYLIDPGLIRNGVRGREPAVDLLGFGQPGACK